MKILSIRRGFDSEHSSTTTEYIGDFKVTCDYDWWYCEFSVPYTRELYGKIKQYEAESDYSLSFTKTGKKIEISIDVHLEYGNIASNNPFIAYANYCMKVKKNILSGNFSDLEVLKAYVELEDKDYVTFIKTHSSKSGIENILQKNC